MKLLTTLCASTALLSAAGFAASADEMANEMTIVSWGGAYTAAQKKAYHDPYMAKTGINIISDDSAPEAVAKLRAMHEAGNITWDLVDVEAADAIRLCDEGLALEIDHDADLASAPDGTSATDDFGDAIVSDCFIPQIIYSTTFGYRTDMVPEGVAPPSSACDVFDLETYPGKRSLNKRPITNLEWALICDGVPFEEVYDTLATPEGQDRAFAKLDTIKDQTIWYSTASETPQLLADGEIFMGSTFNGRLFSLIEEQNQPVGMAWGWQMHDLDGWIVPAGLPAEREARALDFVKMATDTQRLADQASYISYGPSRASSAGLVGKHAELGIEMAPHMPTDPTNAKTSFVNNYEWWADYRDDLDAKFQIWLTQ